MNNSFTDFADDQVDLSDLDPDDDEVLDVLASTFGMSRNEVLDRLACMDLAALREVAE